MKLIAKITAIALTTLVVTTIVIPSYIAVAQKPPQNIALFKESPKELVDETSLFTGLPSSQDLCYLCAFTISYSLNN